MELFQSQIFRSILQQQQQIAESTIVRYTKTEENMKEPNVQKDNDGYEIFHLTVSFTCKMMHERIIKEMSNWFSYLGFCTNKDKWNGIVYIICQYCLWLPSNEFNKNV